MPSSSIVQSSGVGCKRFSNFCYQQEWQAGSPVCQRLQSVVGLLCTDHTGLVRGRHGDVAAGQGQMNVTADQGRGHGSVAVFQGNLVYFFFFFCFVYKVGGNHALPVNRRLDKPSRKVFGQKNLCPRVLCATSEFICQHAQA